MNKPANAPTGPDVEPEHPLDVDTRRILEERLETFDEDAKAARPWEDVLADLKARRPLPPSTPLSHPVRLSSLAALDLQQAHNWFDAREPGRGDTSSNA